MASNLQAMACNLQPSKAYVHVLSLLLVLSLNLLLNASARRCAKADQDGSVDVKVLKRSTTQTGTQMTMGVGTYNYMAPEVVRTKKYDEKVDIYALALIMFYLSSGKRPFYHLFVRGQTLLRDRSNGLQPSSFLLPVVRMLLVAMPGAPSSVLAPSSKARSP